MLNEQEKNLVKKLCSEWIETKNEKDQFTKAMEKALKEDEVYLEMKQQRDAIGEKMEEYKEERYPELVSQKNDMTENMKSIISDSSNKLNIKKVNATKLFSFVKERVEKGVDNLDEIVVSKLEVFED